jgi:hypothetical protein
MALALGTAAALAPVSSWAATPSCGGNCIDPFSFQFGTHHTPNYVLDVYRQGEKAGQAVILFRSSNDDPAEDWTVSFQGTVSDFYADGLVSAAVDLHYGGACEVPEVIASPVPTPTPTPAPVVTACALYYPDLYAWELQYAPYGVDSGLCAGLASTAVSGEKVTLQPCGVTSRTVWITDTVNAAGFRDDYVPVINGSDSNFSEPFVLDYPHDGFPTDYDASASPVRPQLYVDNLTGFSSGSILDRTGVIGTQEWGADIGVLN